MVGRAIRCARITELFNKITSGCRSTWGLKADNDGSKLAFGTGAGREDLSRLQRAHHQYGPAASGNSRRAARDFEVGRRESPRHGVRNWLSASRRREDRRKSHLYDV